MEKYQSLGICGEGAYGSVIKCLHKPSKVVVAIKKIRATGMTPQMRREVDLLKQLRHNNIVHLRETWKDPKFMYLVFEFVETDLTVLLGEAKDGLPGPLVKTFIRQICNSIAFCHERGVVHRDVKPENFLVDRKRNLLKLCDFGNARSIGSGDGKYTAYVSTRWYRAPELLQAYGAAQSSAKAAAASASAGPTKQVSLKNIQYSFAVDVWSIGCMFAELITGNPFFPADTTVKQLLMIQQHGGILDGAEAKCEAVLRKRVQKLSDAGFDLLKHMLLVNPAKRVTAQKSLEHPYITEESPRKGRRSRKSVKGGAGLNDSINEDLDIDTDVDDGSASYSDHFDDDDMSEVEEIDEKESHVK